MVGIGLGLATALVWGLSDVAATFGSRRLGPFQVVLGFHVLSTVGLAVAVVATGALDGVTGEQLLVIAAASTLAALFYPMFFRALEIGPISIVSPVVSGYAAVAVVMAVLVLGERLGAGQTVAVVVAFLGVALSSTDLAGLRRVERAQALGVLYALFAAITGGIYLFTIGYYSAELGWLGPVFLGRAFATAYLLVASIRGHAWRRLPVRSRATVFVVAIACLDTAGYLFYNLGVTHADTSLVATATAPYALVPAVVGVLLLGERPRPVQILGSLLVIVGLVLLGLFS